MSGWTPIFDTLFSGSLYGQYPDTAAWLYLLALADKNGCVDVTPEYIAGVTGMPVADLKACISRFMEPDSASRTTENEGRRLELIDPERNWGWKIVNHGRYREKARLQAKNAREVADGQNRNRMNTRRRPPVTAGDRPSNTNTNKDTERDANRTRRSRHVPADFHVNTDMLKFALALGLDETTIASETQKFADHEFDKPKKDWVGTWRNWMRRTAEYRQANNKNEDRETTATLAADLGLKQRTDESDDRFAKRVCDVDTLRRYAKG